MATKITKGPPKPAEPPVSTAADDRIPSRKKGKKELPPPAAPATSPFETIGTSIKSTLIQVGDTAQRIAKSARVFAHTVRTASARPERNIVQAIEDGFADAAKAFAPKPDFATLADEAEDYLDALRHAAQSNPKLTPVVREMEAHYQGILAAGVASAVWDYHHDPEARPVAQRQAMDFADSFYRAVPTEDSLEGVFTTYAAVDLDVAKLRRAVTRNAEMIRGHVSKKAHDASQPVIDAANRGLPMGEVPLSHPSPAAQGPAAVFLQAAGGDHAHVLAKAENTLLEPQLMATEARIAALIQSTHADAPFRREAHLGLAHIRMGSPAVGVRHLEAARQIFRDKGDMRPPAEDLATQIGVLHRIADHSPEDAPRARDRLSEAEDAIALLAKRKGMRNPAILLHVDNLLLQQPHRLKDQEDFLARHPDEVERYHRAVAMEYERVISYCTRVESDDKTVMGIVRGQGMMQAAAQFERRLDGAMSLRLTGATEEARQAHLAAGNAFTHHKWAFEHAANPALMTEAMGRMHWSNATYTFKIGDVEQSLSDLRTLTGTYGDSSAAQILRDGADDTWVRKYGIVDASGNLSPDIGRPSEVARWKKIADAALSDKASATKAMMAGAGIAVVGAASADALFGTHIVGGKVLGGLTLGKLGMIGAGAGLITERGVQVLAAQQDISAAYTTGIANVTTDELAERGKALAGEVAVCFIAGGAARYVRMGVMGLGAKLRAPLLKGLLSEASIAAEGVAFHEYSGMIHGVADHSAMGYFRSILTLRMLGAGGELNLGSLVFPGEKWADAVMRHGFNTAVANVPLQALESAIARDLSGFGHGYFDSLFGLYAITVGGKVPEAVMRAPQLLARAKAAHVEKRVETLARQLAQVAKKNPSKAKVIARTIAEIIKTAAATAIHDWDSRNPISSKMDGKVAVYSGVPFIGDMARRALEGLQYLVGGPPPGQASPVSPADVPARPAVMGDKDVLIIPPRQGDSANLPVAGFPGVEYRWHRGKIEIRDTRKLEPEKPLDPPTAMHVRQWKRTDMPVVIEGRILKPNTWHQLDYGDIVMLGAQSHTLVKSGLAPRHLGRTPPPLPPRPGEAARQVLRPRTPSQPRRAAPPDIPPIPKEAQAKAEASQSLQLKFQEGEVALDFSTTPEKAIGYGRYGITDPSLAAHHATLMYRDGFLFIRDCGSSAGTFVNNERVFSSGMLRLYEGDRVRMGDTTFTIHHPQGALDARQIAPTAASGAAQGSQFRLVSRLAGAKSMTIAPQKPGEAVPFPGIPGVYLMIDTGGRLLISDTRDPRKTEDYRQAVAMQHTMVMGFDNAPISRNGKDIPTDRQWHPLEDGDELYGHIMACTVSITPLNPIDVMLAQDPALRKNITSRLQDATSVADLEQLLPTTLLPSNLSRAALQTVSAVMSGRQALLDLPEVLQPVVEGIMNRQVAELLGLGYDSQGVMLDPKHTNPKWSATEKAYHRGMAARNLTRQIAEAGSLAELTRILETSRVSSIRYQSLDSLVLQLRDNVMAGALALQHLPYDLGLRQKLRDILEEHRFRDTESASRLLPEDAHQHAAYRDLDHAEDALYLQFEPRREALYQVLERGKPLSMITRNQQMRKAVVAHMEATIAIAGRLFPMEMAARENIFTGETVTKEHIETSYRLARMLLNAHANRPVWGTPSRAEQTELIALVQKTFGSQAAPNYLQAQRLLRHRLEEMGPGATRMLQIATPEERALILESYFGAYSHRVIPDPAAAFRLAAWLGKSGIYREVAMSLVAVNGHYYGKVSMGHTGSVHRESSGDILVMHTHPEEYTTTSGDIMGHDYDSNPATMSIGLGIKSRDSRTIVFSKGDIHHFLSEAKRLRGNPATPKSVVYDPESRSYRNWVLHPFGGSDVTIRLAPNGKPEHITVRYAKMPGGFFNENYRHGIRNLKIFCETELDIPMTATEVSFDELMASVAYPLNE